MSLKKVGSKRNSLEKAISAWKTEHGERSSLTAASRNRVLRSAVAGPESSGLPGISSLFPIYPRIALAALVPACLLTVVLVLTLNGGSVMDHLPDGDVAPATITVEKVGNQVVFNIANGEVAHSVSKSNTPHTFDPAKAVRVQDGSYRDSLNENGNLVFYRID